MDAELKDILDKLPLNDAKNNREPFFHSCWMRLKSLRPDVWEDMTKTELYIAGLPIPGEDDKNDSDKDKDPPTQIL